ncbi:hypothetical protein AB0I82_18150 [Streptomyces sp. NPDC050315]|uniref:hypothetical protein n=1 Tax=Streptomyces sp. NPDC050315 TaxID=3155039 RepID=UPI0034340443
MSRESDSSSSGPQGRGAAAYPSGTPPYGTRQGDADEAVAARPEEPRTETTLTTRIKINIPGSRPIPPVVVRKPVGEDAAANGADGAGGGRGGAGSGRTAERTGSTPRPRPQAAPPALGTPAASAENAPEDRKEPAGPTGTSDWFAPRRPKRPAAGQAPAAQGGTPPTGTPPTGGQSPAGGQGSGSGQFPQRPAGGGRPGQSAPGQSAPGQDSVLPYFSDGPAAPGGGGPAGPGGTPPGTPGPSGPTTGPASGDLSFPGNGPGGDFPGAGHADGGRPRSGLEALAAGETLPPSGPSGLTGERPGGAPAGTDDWPSGDWPGGGLTGGATPPPLRDDTAPLTPQQAPPGGAVGPVTGTDDRTSSDTLVSGIPTVSADSAPPAPKRGARSGPSDASAAPKPPQRAQIPEPINPRKKGRNKLVLAFGGIVVLAAVAYGAGLVLDHSDVPGGTTALGVDIGGSTKEQAVEKLDAALKDTRTAPLKLTVDGQPQTLLPAKAGLDIDTQATVRGAAGRDYNPVSVIGSLFGGARTAEPAMIVDDEKLDIALKAVAGEQGAAKDGGIVFAAGKAVPHYGKPYKSIDVAAAKQEVTQAYQERLAGADGQPVALKTSMQRPTVPDSEVNRALKTFARPAMSGLITVRTDAEHTVSFSPEKSIPKFLSMKPVNGKLVEYYDRPALKSLYGDTFKGVLVTKGDGSKKPVSVEEVASAVSQALRGATPAQRVVTIPTNPS